MKFIISLSGLIGLIVFAGILVFMNTQIHGIIQLLDNPLIVDSAHRLALVKSVGIMITVCSVAIFALYVYKWVKFTLGG